MREGAFVRCLDLASVKFLLENEVMGYLLDKARFVVLKKKTFIRSEPWKLSVGSRPS